MWTNINGIGVRTKKFDKAHVPPTQTNKVKRKNASSYNQSTIEKKPT